jgi:PST family polysaccharide transporter
MHLAVLQMVNYLLPLLIMPFLIRTIGLDGMGKLNFALTIILYIQLLVDYGFNLTATKNISQCKDDKNKLNEIYTCVMLIKCVILLSSLSIFSVLIFNVEYLCSDWLLYICTFGIVIGYTLFPVWLFQGLQEMKYITQLNLLSRAIYTLLIFLVISSKDDLVLIPLFSSFAALFVTGVSLWLVRTKLQIKPNINYVKNAKDYLKGGWDVFLQQFYVSLYIPLNIIFLGLLTSSEAVGVFTIAQTVATIPLLLITVGMQAYFPHAVQVYKEDSKLYLYQIKKLMLIISIYSIAVIALSFFFSRVALEIFIGNEFLKIEEVYNILIFGLFFGAFSQIITQVFVTIEKAKILSKISFITMILSLGLSPIIINIYGVIGLSIFTVFRQFFVISCCLFILIGVLNKNGTTHFKAV